MTSAAAPYANSYRGEVFVGLESAALCWFALRTRSRSEKIVADQLQRQGIESFLPLLRQSRRWSDRQKTVEMPLFSGYCFVRLAPSSADRLRVLQTHGVAGFVGWQGTAAVIPDSQIDDIRTVLASRVSFQQHPFLQVGQRIRVRGGALDGVEGILSQQDEHSSLVISLGVLQRSLSVRIQGYMVEAA